MRMRDPHRLAQRGVETPVRACGGELPEIDSVATEYFLRQPTRPTAAVFPHILEDVGHLQALRERDVELVHRGTLTGDLRRIPAEQLRQHLSHDTGNVIT